MYTTAAMPRLLATGFYDRGNLGDTCYPLVLRRVFGSDIECVCTDDLRGIPEGTEAVIVGGGDVVNPFFMDKVAQLLQGFAGPAYLLSIGIPFAGGDLGYLAMFDHVFVRTAADYKLASTVLPSSDLTCYRDMAWSLPRTVERPVRSAQRLPCVAVALAQPYFANNAHGAVLKDAVVELVTALAKTSSEVLLLAFNTRLPAVNECDILLNREICARAGMDNVRSVEDVTDPEAMLQLYDRVDLLIAMRLHSIIFAAMKHLPFVCMYTTRKVGNLLEDLGAAEWGVQLPLDARCKPTTIDAGRVLDMAERRLACEAAFQWQEPAAPPTDWQHVREVVASKKRRTATSAAPVMTPFSLGSAKCRKLLLSYTGMAAGTYDTWLDGKLPTNQVIDEGSVSLLEVCRLICYALSGSTCSPCLWGLHENIRRPDFHLGNALRYIHNDHMKKQLSTRPPGSNCPARRHYVQVTRQDLLEFADTHRAGWPFVVSGLMSFDAASHGRAPEVLVDTYVDRTFHWGRAALELEGAIPYRRPWVGFVHHTFTLDHGPYNCAALFSTPSFLASLPACRCLVALSSYLASGLRSALDKAGFPGVAVEVLLHPTEPVPELMRFSMDKLLHNPAPKLVQIGSWLRSSYALYKMPVLPGGDIRLQRCILKAKESANYLKPRAVEDALQKMLDESEGLKDISLPKTYNFYVRELIEHIREEEQSVQLLDRLSNDEYDALLSSNVTFLRLIDCSACNTIIETIMRDGIVVCNRHPAAAEYLNLPDAEYPGFYDTLAEAAAISSSVERLRSCHEHIKRLDKGRLALPAFVDGFAALLDKVLGSAA